ncbi:hypothetical protein AOZ07_01440 [Glutamicibacter halophytocola]|nr:hypothetical protein AOZ07_01440 [Glutamicibacter halophytocola]
MNSRLLKMAWGLAGTVLLVAAFLVVYLWADNGLASALSNQSAAVAWPTYVLLALAALWAVVVTVFTRRKLDLEAQLALLQAKPYDS